MLKYDSPVACHHRFMSRPSACTSSNSRPPIFTRTASELRVTAWVPAGIVH
jgi:hypothetical protein